MLKNKTKIIALLLVLFLLIAAPFTYADNETSEDNTMATSDAIPISDTSETKPVETNTNNTTSQEDSYKKSDVYLTGDNVSIDYIVDGNLFIMANTVTINSQIGGDAFIIAKKIIVEDQGYIFNNLFAISESIEIKGVIFDAFALAKDFTISGGYVYRDAKIACQNLNINGTIGRNAFVNCSNINFNTDGNTQGIIYGDLTYSAPSAANFSDDFVNGKINYNATKASTNISVREIVANYIYNLGTFLAFALIIWLICLWLTPKFLSNTNQFVGKKTLKVLGTGLLTLIAVPIACIILILLQLTSGISLLTIAVYILAISIAKSIFTIVANNYICSKLNINKNTGIFGMLIVSCIVVWAICKLPFISGIASFIISVLGLGVIVSAILPKKTNKTDEIKESKKDKKTIDNIKDSTDNKNEEK